MKFSYTEKNTYIKSNLDPVIFLSGHIRIQPVRSLPRYLQKKGKFM